MRDGFGYCVCGEAVGGVDGWGSSEWEVSEALKKYVRKAMRLRTPTDLCQGRLYILVDIWICFFSYFLFAVSLGSHTFFAWPRLLSTHIYVCVLFGSASLVYGVCS